MYSSTTGFFRRVYWSHIHIYKYRGPRGQQVSFAGASGRNSAAKNHNHGVQWFKWVPLLLKGSSLYHQSKQCTIT